MATPFYLDNTGKIRNRPHPKGPTRGQKPFLVSEEPYPIQQCWPLNHDLQIKHLMSLHLPKVLTYYFKLAVLVGLQKNISSLPTEGEHPICQPYSAGPRRSRLLGSSWCWGQRPEYKRPSLGLRKEKPQVSTRMQTWCPGFYMFVFTCCLHVFACVLHVFYPWKSVHNLVMGWRPS